MPLTLWPEAFATAVYLINRLTTPILDNNSPYQKLFQTTPNYGKLRTFGSLCYPWLRPYAPNKLEHRSTPCVFVGYSFSQSAYLCLDPTTDRVYTSRHVRFNENQFPYHQLQNQTTIPTPKTVNPQTYQPHTTIYPVPPLVQSSSMTTESSPPSSATSPHVTPPMATTEPDQQNNTDNTTTETEAGVTNTGTATAATTVETTTETPSEPPYGCRGWEEDATEKGPN